MGKTSRQTVTKVRAAAGARPDAPVAASPEPDTGVWAAVAAAVAGTERAAAEAVERVAVALRAAARPAPAVQAAVDTAAGAVVPGRPLDPEWSSMLADPVLPLFSPDIPDAPAAVSFAAPAEQGLWRDLSLASRVAAAVRADEARFAAAFDCAPTPLLIASTDAGSPGRVVSANVAMGRLLGRSPASLLDLSLRDLSVQELLSASGVDGPGDEPPAVRCEWRHAAGHLVPVRVRMAPGNGPAEVVLHVEQVPEGAASRGA